VDIPNYHVSATIVGWAVVVGPIIGVAAVGFVRLVAWVSYHAVKGRKAIGAPLVAFGMLGLIGIQYPQLFGNGKDMAHDAFLGNGSLALLGALFFLKPLVTSLCLGSGASGGLFTPVMSTGAVLGGFLGIVWSHVGGGAPVGACALVGAAAMIGAAMQAPLAALVIVLELTHTGFSLMVPMTAATVGATAIARYLDGYSIYSARLSAVET
jgi:H+/Cl- antiporter ClcA